MPEISAHQHHVLITNVGSFLGVSLAKSLLLKGYAVFGVGSSQRVIDLVSEKDFTLLELDLAQPLPQHLPNFELIFHLLIDEAASDKLFRAKNDGVHLDEARIREPRTLVRGDLFSSKQSIPPQEANLLSIARNTLSSVSFVAPITTNTEVWEGVVENHPEFKAKPQLFLLGDLYGPKMRQQKKDSKAPNELIDLISQALETDKVILENEGLKNIYPAYITDVVDALNKLAITPTGKTVHYLISEDPKTSLSVAYEIQNAARFVLGKELGLFFKGAEPASSQAEPLIKIHSLGYIPKTKLAEGLKETFAYFLNPESNDHQNSPAPIVPHSLQIQEGIPDSPKITTKRRLKLPKLPRIALLPKNLRDAKAITSKLPSPSSIPSFRVVMIVVLALLVLTTLKTGLDLYLGVTNIKSSQKAAWNGNFQQAQKKAESSAKSFHAAQNKLKIALAPIALIASGKVKGIEYALSSAETTGYALASFAQGSEIMTQNFKIVADASTKKESFDLENPQAYFQKAYFDSAKGLELAKKADKTGIFKNATAAAINSSEQLNHLSQSSYELTNLMSDFTGTEGTKTYLLLLQNNTELRPGGGFIGNIGEITFENGRLTKIAVEDVYALDGQLKEKIEPPRELKEKLDITQLFLRDSNWSGDFDINAATARDLYKKETSKTVDGVIAFDLTFMQNVLARIGPLKLEDYDEEITAQNLFEKGEYYSEVGFFPGSTQKRDFFGSLSRELIAKVLASLTTTTDSEDQKHLGSLVEVTKEGLSQSHLMLSFDAPKLASFARTHMWNHAVPPTHFNPADLSTETKDFLAIVEANVGANKVNRFIDRKIAYEMTVGRDADLVGKLTITYTNNSQADTWPGGKYTNFLRVYVPYQATVFEYANGDKTDIKDITGSLQGNLTQLATYVEVPHKSTKVVSFTYRIPRNIKIETAPTYHLYVQKQPGTEKDPFEFKFNLPGYLVAKTINGQNAEDKQNLTVSTNLLTDRQFEIVVAKK